MNNALYWIWIQQAVGQGSSAVPKLLKAFSSPTDIYAADRLTLEKAGISGKALDGLCRKTLNGAERLLERALKHGWILTLDDESYPNGLRQIYSPPLVLYGSGVLPLFNEPSAPPIAVVGTREATAYGEEAAGGMAAGLAAVGCLVISGGARGIDRAAHEGAMYGGGKTVAVQACGLDVEYPLKNRLMRRHILEQGGALITEYAPGTIVHKHHFTVRNRLISGLAWGVCVAEAPQRSGALITARTAREQDRDVFVIPGNITSAESYGSNELIKEGAQMVSRPSEILAVYQHRFGDALDEAEADRAQTAYGEYQRMSEAVPVPSESPAARLADRPLSELQECPEDISEDAKRIFAALSDVPQNVEDVCATAGLPVNRAFVALTQLEMFGCIRNHPGKRYSRG